MRQLLSILLLLPLSLWAQLPTCPLPAHVGSVQLFPEGGDTNVPALGQPIVPLAQPFPLRLSFDVLGENAPSLEARILRCDVQWRPANINPIEYQEGFRSIRLQEIAFSQGTKVPYTHFTAQLPRIKQSGNYLLEVYQAGRPKEVLFCRPFMVYEQLVDVPLQLQPVAGPEGADHYQQLDFVINTEALPTLDPARDVQVVLRQNHRWDNARRGLQPRFANGRNLDYRYFNLENAFLGGNEYRQMSSSGMYGTGMNVRHYQTTDTLTTVWLYTDLPRGKQTYNQQQQDQDGAWIPYAAGRRDAGTEADYMRVCFSLKAEQPFEAPVYVGGAFSDWRPDARYRMHYDQGSGTYQACLLLKQGQYDYQYFSEDPQVQQQLEGNFRLTRNTYDVLVYFQAPTDRAPRLVGYRKVVDR